MRRRLTQVLAGVAGAVALATSCTGGGDAQGPTSVYLTIENGAGAPVPDQLRLTATGDQGIVFDQQRIPMSGALRAQGNTVLGTITLYLGDRTGDLRIDVSGYVAQALRSQGTTSLSIVRDRQTTARVALQAVDADGGGDAVPVPITDAAADRAVGDAGALDLAGAGGSGSGSGGTSGTGGASADAGTGTGGAGTGGLAAGTGGAGTGGSGSGGRGTGGAAVDAGADGAPRDGPACLARFNFENGNLYGAAINTGYQTAFTSVASGTDAYCGNGALQIAAKLDQIVNTKGEIVIPFAQPENLSGKTLSLALKSTPTTTSNALVIVFLVPSYTAVVSYSPFPGTWTVKSATLPTGVDAGTSMVTGLAIQAQARAGAFVGTIGVDEIDIR